MLPTQSVCGSAKPHLPIPHLTHQSIDPMFTRSRQFMNPFPPSLVSQISTYNSNHISSKDTNYIQSGSSGGNQLSTGPQNLQQELQHKSNPMSFIPLNKEVRNSPSKQQEPLPEQMKINGSNISVGSSTDNCQANGSAANTRIPGESLVPAVDPYSFYNRLCELFPDIHPPQLQRVFDECGRDFLRTIDNVLYARRLRKSIIAQMSKFRSQQRNQSSNNLGPNPPQQKDQETDNCPQAQGCHQPKPEKQPRQSPKSYPNAKNATNVTAKRSRILAYQPQSSPTVNSSRRGCINSPKCNQTSQGPGTSSQQCLRKTCSPPPNVFVHQIDMGQQIGGSGDATLSRKINPGYIFSFKKPPTNTFGIVPQPSSNKHIPMSSTGDFNSFCTLLPPPPSLPFCAPQQFTFPDWSPRVSGQLDLHVPPAVPHETPQQQQEQQSVNNEGTSTNHQPISDEDHLSGERNLEAPQRSNEQESNEWTLLLKNILDPMHPMDSNISSGMINTQPAEANEVYGSINQNKQDNGNFLFKANEPPGYSFVSDSLRKHLKENCDVPHVEDTTDAHETIKLGNDSVHNSLSEKINVTDLNRTEEPGIGDCNTTELMKSSPSEITNGSRQSLGDWV